MANLIEFKLQIVCKDKQSFETLEILKDIGIKYELKEKIAFAPSPEMWVEIILKIALPVFATVIPILFKRLSKRDIKITFDTRFDCAKEMLADKSPLLCEYREDRADFSRYVFKTKESNFFWEFDRGNIKYGKGT